MRLTLWLLGTEVLTISTDRADPDQPDDDHHIRHDGAFEIGFRTTPGWLSDVEARLQRHPPGPRR
ncbi:hypothetical protein [Pseudonocardia sp.]|uniref:hypothetical protein n=1 Tax=Pseudonocardia sp. TaxID=60912 RepID=UPI003D0FEC56